MAANSWTRGKIRAGSLDITGTTEIDGAVTLNGTATINFLALGGAGTDPVLYGNAQAIVQQNPLSAKPSSARGAALGIVSNSTGVALVVNVTGTTWKYLNTTAIQPT